MNAKIRVGIVFGGASSEHEVSCLSAWSVLQHIDRASYDITPIFIDRKGVWYALDFETISPMLEGESPFFRGEFSKSWCDSQWSRLDPFFSPTTLREKLDVAFAVMHGEPGENGELAGLFACIGVPLVGSGVLSSAICMHKGVSKRLALAANVQVAPYIELHQGEKVEVSDLVKQLGLPLFIKPVGAGSSVGVSRIEQAEEIKPACIEAFKYGSSVLVESAIEGREIEVAVLEHEGLTAMPLGEVVAGEAFYSYSAKYDKASKASTYLVTDLDEMMTQEIQDTALKVFKALGCEGLARVDFFLTPKGDLIFNEINSLPGFTSISLYPVMCAAHGITFTNLITILIEHALTRAGKHPLLAASL